MQKFVSSLLMVALFLSLGACVRSSSGSSTPDTFLEEAFLNATAEAYAVQTLQAAQSQLEPTSLPAVEQVTQGEDGLIAPETAADLVIVAQLADVDGWERYSADLSVRVSPDENDVKMWQASNGTLLQTFSGHTDRVWDVVFSPDGLHLATASMDWTVRLWNIESGVEEKFFMLTDLSLYERASELAPSFAAYRVSFSPNGTRLVAGTYGFLAVWDVESGKLLNVITGDEEVYPSGVGLAYLRGDRLVDIQDGRIRLWDARQGSLLHVFAVAEEGIPAYAVSPDGQLLAAAALAESGDHLVHLYETKQGQEVFTLQGFGAEAVTALAFSPDGRLLAAGTRNYLYLFEVASGQLLANYETEGVSGLTFSADGRKLVNALMVWSVASGGDLVEGVDGTLELVRSGYVLVSGARKSTRAGLQLVSAPGGAYFFNWEDEATIELWHSDGSRKGTQRIRNIEMTGFIDRAVVGEQLYFAGVSSDGNRVLWRSDGTNQGTELLGAFMAGERFYTLAAGRNSLFFTLAGPEGSALWRSSGSLIDTVIVRDFGVGVEDFAGMVEMNDLVYFTALNYEISGRELWQTDGSVEGTLQTGLVLPPESDTGLRHTLAVYHGQLFFLAPDEDGSWFLWAGDGTPEGTHPAVQITTSGSGMQAANLTPAGSRLYFTLHDSQHWALWSSDGSADSTMEVYRQQTLEGSSPPDSLTMAGDTLYFRAADETQDGLLWRCDGTAAGAYRLFGRPVVDVALLDGSLLFTAVNREYEGVYDLWRYWP